ncbi:MAG: rhombosortase [Gammaproteobacteria bacterium]|nr:rhombosortase [Gammaproteobacteria bacterium]
MGVSGFVNHVHLTLRSLNCDGRRGLALLLGCVLLLLPTLAGKHGQALLRYERSALAAGQWWRLLTAHLVHLDLRHALLNAAGLALIWALFARDYSPRGWLAIVLGAAAAIDAGLWLGDSTVQWYVGSSGVLHGAMAAGTLAHLRNRERDGWLLLTLLAAKLLYEQSVGALPFSGRDPVVVDAHLYGVLGGGAVAAFLSPRRGPL